MFCEKCGGELRQEENKLVCTKCGAEFGAESAAQAPSAEYVVPRGFSSKKNIIIIIAAAVLMAGIVGIIVAVNTTKPSSQTALSGIEIAERYLSEQNYEQAVIEFEKILEIEPMNVDAYIGLAEAYIGMGDTEKALEALREGLEQTGDPRLQAKIDELTKPEEPPVSSSASYSTSSEPVESEPVESKPVFGSMGSVTIHGEEYDIATTSYFEFNGDSLTDEDVNQIGKLTNLTFLKFVNNHHLSDITPLAGLTNLESLVLYNTQISDITPLAGLTNLTYLRLSNNQISDITPLAGLTNLTGLNLNINQISNLTPLAGLTNLYDLELYNNQISDLTPLAGLSNLSWLNLQYNEISDITPLAGLTNLYDLQLAKNQISDLTPLAGLSNLADLGLGSNQISDITPLAGLTNLYDLGLGGNQISEEDIAWLKEQLQNCEIRF